MSSKGDQNGLKCLKNVKMHIGREMSIIRGMHRRSRHVKKSKHAQLHAQSIPMHISAMVYQAGCAMGIQKCADKGR
jgi:hypothetical protein